MFTCLAICKTYACQLVIFISEEILFLDAIKLSVVQRAVFYLYSILFDIVTKQLLHLLFGWKAVRYLNLVNARPSQVERISLRLYSLLVEFASALLRVVHVAYA